MYNANREHKATLSRMEQKFFEEKVCIVLSVVCVQFVFQ